MQKWELCRMSYHSSEVSDCYMTYEYYGPGGVKRDEQKFKKKTDVRAIFDHQVTRLLNDGWEPLPTEMYNTLNFKRPYRETT